MWRERPGLTPELYVFELWSPTLTQAVALRVELWTDPGSRHAWYAAHLFRPGEALVTLTERAPRRSGFELRASGLWADHNIEIPFEHWSLGLEAFALAVDHPAEDRGLRVPFGFELDWEMSPTRRQVTAGGYEQPALVRGEVFVGSDRYEIDTDGWRSHRVVGSLPADAHVHGSVAAAQGGLIWNRPGDEPTGQRWGWAHTDIPSGTLRSGPWFDGTSPNVAGFAEMWRPAGRVP